MHEAWFCSVNPLKHGSASRESQRRFWTTWTWPKTIGSGDIGPDTEVPLAITGIVPCKVCDEGGPIRAGDLLVAASIPGHAKKAPASPKAGTLVGKALGKLTGKQGKIEVLITMR